MKKRSHLRYSVDDSGCWLWQGCTSSGYGRIRVKGVTMRAHRLSYELHIGPIPEGRLVCHKCDVPACINPDHLFLGTHQDNCDDKMAKGRGRGPVRSERQKVGGYGFGKNFPPRGKPYLRI